jgi:hypothetical protein
VKVHKSAVSAALGGASAVAQAVRYPGAAKLRAERAMAALLLAARGGARYASSVPPMSPELAAQVVTEQLGLPPERAFATWDPEPIAAASIGQVHRAITHDGRAVAVKVQYPGIDEIIKADLDNVALLRPMLRVIAPAQDVGVLLAELRDRIAEELDYRTEARNQQMFARYYDGHPTIHIPGVVPDLSTRRVFTSELAVGARFAELADWPQAERDLAAETIYRFVFRSLYHAHAFNGDPHPGNYLFHGGGKVTFLDFGLVRRFSANDLRPLSDMVRYLCVDHDPEAFRRANEHAGILIPDAPVSTHTVVDQMAVFYDMVREPGPRTMTGEYATAVAGRLVDVRSPLAAYVRLPRSYVILQRINLGLYALLGKLSATADWRRISEEIWPFIQAPPSTPTGTAEATWRTEHPLLSDEERPARHGCRQYLHQGDARWLPRNHHDIQRPEDDTRQRKGGVSHDRGIRLPSGSDRRRRARRPVRCPGAAQRAGSGDPARPG